MRRFNNYDIAGQPPVLAWNPIAMRCTPVGDGCRNCWHLRMCDRLARNHWLPPSVRMAYEGGEVEALKSFTAYPPSGRVIAVQFMGDLWHTSVLQSYRDCILSTIRQCPESVFLLLTKRPYRIIESIPDNAWVGTTAWDTPSLISANQVMLSRRNVGKHRWLSLEPLLSRDIDLFSLDIYEFVAFGPETLNGREVDDSRWMDRVGERGEIYPYTRFYDKRRNWISRDWPDAWKNLDGKDHLKCLGR